MLKLQRLEDRIDAEGKKDGPKAGAAGADNLDDGRKAVPAETSNKPFTRAQGN